MGIKEDLKDILTDKYISGTEIAKQLGVTRQYVSRSVKDLQEDGIQIDVDQRNGYRLSPNQDIMTVKKISSLLNTKYIGKKLYVLDEIDSTNNYAKELAKENAPEGTLVISDCQTGGKGRMGREFVSPHNAGLYYSVILRPKLAFPDSQLITSAAAVAVAETIDEVCNVNTKIKWVNDIFLNNRKICGILTEGGLSVESGLLEYAVCGIGINVFESKAYSGLENNSIATTIETETGKRFSRNKIAAVLSNKLEKNLEELHSRKFLTVYRKKSNIINQPVIVTINGEEKNAIAIGIDDNASLIVKFENDEIKHLNSGEARIRKNL